MNISGLAFSVLSLYEPSSLLLFISTRPNLVALGGQESDIQVSSLSVAIKLAGVITSWIGRCSDKVYRSGSDHKGRNMKEREKTVLPGEPRSRN